MYLHGLGFSEDYYNMDSVDSGDWWLPGGGDYDSPDTTASTSTDTGVFGSSDWINVIGAGIKTWGQVEMAANQGDVAVKVAQAKNPPILYRAPPAYNASGQLVSYPFPNAGAGAGGALFGMDTTTIMILAALGIGAVFVMKE